MHVNNNPFLLLKKAASLGLSTVRLYHSISTLCKPGRKGERHTHNIEDKDIATIAVLYRKKTPSIKEEGEEM